MFDTRPQWLRDRLESGQKFPDPGTWKLVCLLVGIIAFLGLVLFWLWTNLANFR
jgi:hypothetical protein